MRAHSSCEPHRPREERFHFASPASVGIGIGTVHRWPQGRVALRIAGCGILLGLLHGVLNGIERAKLPSISGSSVGVAVALFVLVSLLAGQVTTVRAPWAILGWSVRAVR